MRKAIIAEIVACLFILLFVYAAVSKLLDFDQFRMQLAQSPLLYYAPNTIAWLVPGAELVIVLALLNGTWRLAGLYASFTLMTIFSGYIIAITRYSEYIPCSCGGVLSKMSWNQHLVFNIGFVILAGLAILLYHPDNNIIHTDTNVFKRSAIATAPDQGETGIAENL